MSGRKYPSGSQKRKLKEKKIAKALKSQKLSDFFVKKSHQPNPEEDDTEEILLEVEEPKEAGVSNQEDGASNSLSPHKCDSMEIESEQYTQPLQQQQPEINQHELDNFDKYSDLAMWPMTISKEFIVHCLMKNSSFFQNRSSNNIYVESNRIYKEQNRSFSNKYFEKVLKNGQHINRSWLCYSKSKGCIYCLVCKIFSKVRSSLLSSEGFSDWVNILRTLENHEDSAEHQKTMFTWITRKENKYSVNKQMEDEIKKNIQYYFEVLQRVVTVIKFLTERGLPLRGHDEKWGSPSNGNFMGLIELIAQYDPFLREHLAKCQGDKVTYLSKTVVEEIVEIMGKRVLREIVNHINNEDTKYFSIIVDSTPDLSNMDQLAIVVRYCRNGKPYKRFLTFSPIENHTAEHLFNTIKQILENLNLPLENIRGQSYDNAANMSGKYKGLQTLFKGLNAHAEFVPCAAHSLNLVGVEAVSVVAEIVDYFGIVQQLYVYFSASSHRWNILANCGNLKLALKKLNTTRWCAHYQAVHALKQGYHDVLKTLKYISEGSEEKPDCKREGKNLFNKLIKLECAILTIMWDEILERFNKNSTKLQTPGLDVCEGYRLISSLISFTTELREHSDTKIEEYEIAATEMSQNINKHYSDLNKRIRTNKFSDSQTDRDLYRGRDKFRIDVVNRAFDCLISELKWRNQLYKNIGERFEFLADLTSGDLGTTINEANIKSVVAYYSSDIDDNLINECRQFKKYLTMTVRTEVGEDDQEKQLRYPKLLELIYDRNLIEVFPNLTTILKIYLTIPITSCEAERNFSKLSIIKNKYRSTMLEDRLNYLAILSIENDITKSLTYYETIKEYAEKKIRKKRIM